MASVRNSSIRAASCILSARCGLIDASIHFVRILSLHDDLPLLHDLGIAAHAAQISTSGVVGIGIVIDGHDGVSSLALSLHGRLHLDHIQLGLVERLVVLLGESLTRGLTLAKIVSGDIAQNHDGQHEEDGNQAPKDSKHSAPDVPR